jgi:hypothetical protein
LTHKHDDVYIRARLKPGWERWFFTALSSGCEFLPAQTIRFFPPLFNETLDASRKEGFFFYEPIPQPFDG